MSNRRHGRIVTSNCAASQILSRCRFLVCVSGALEDLQDRGRSGRFNLLAAVMDIGFHQRDQRRVRNQGQHPQEIDLAGRLGSVETFQKELAQLAVTDRDQ